MQRIILVIALVLMIIFALVASFFLIPSLLPFGRAQVVPTATPYPTPTPTSIPTPTPTPTTSVVTQVKIIPTYLIEASNGKALVNIDSNLRLPMASTTKIMTAILAIENSSLTTEITITQTELDEVLPGGYSTAFLQPNDQMTMLDLLYALLLPSGCDAAMVIAHAIAGSTTNFVAMMNARARTLGLTNTHFTNPAGFIDANNYSTPADLTTLARYAMTLSTFEKIVGTRDFVLPATQNHHLYNTWQNLNQLLNLYPGADGIKTGTSNDAGYCLVFSATRNGHRLIGTIMQESSEEQLYPDAMSALDKGFSFI